jgi:hypothetical protein
MGYEASWRWTRWVAWRPVRLGKYKTEGWAWLCWLERSYWEFGSLSYHKYRRARPRD